MGLASTAGQAVAGVHPRAAVAATGPGAEGLLLRKIEHGIAEICPVDACSGKTALHEHGVAQHSIAQVGALKAAGIGNGIFKISTLQIGLLQVAAIEHSTPQIGAAEVKCGQFSLEKFLLLEIASMHIGLQVLQRPLAPQLRRSDRPGWYGPADQ